MKRRTDRAIPAADERLLLRLLHGELPPDETAALERRLEGEPALAARYRRLAELWHGLELPPAAVPVDFRRDVLRAVERRVADDGTPAPAWLRLAAAAALLVGLGLGVGLGRLGVAAAGEQESWPVLVDEAPTLAERYWQSLEASGGRLGPEEPRR